MVTGKKFIMGDKASALPPPPQPDWVLRCCGVAKEKNCTLLNENNKLKNRLVVGLLLTQHLLLSSTATDLQVWVKG